MLLLFLVVILVGSFFVAIRGIGTLEERDQDAFLLLQDRYERGDISVSEYLEMKKLLHLHSRER